MKTCPIHSTHINIAVLLTTSIQSWWIIVTRRSLLLILLVFSLMKIGLGQVITPPCDPDLDCVDRFVSCDDPSASVTGDPGYEPARNNISCTSALVSTPWIENIADCSSPYSHVIYRMWRIEGTITTLCTDATYVERVDISSSDFECIEGQVTFECGEPNPLTDLTLRAPTYNGYPLTPENGALCGVNVVFQDDPWPICGNSKTVIRTWDLHDGCGNAVTCKDTITLVDNTPPDLNFDGQELSMEEHTIGGITKEYPTDTIYMDAHNCLGHGLAPYAEVTDLCSDPQDLTVSVKTDIGEILAHYNGDENKTLPIWNIPGPMQVLVYHAQDPCGNERMDTIVLIVVDRTPAIAACHNAINLSLTNVDQFSFMQAESLDAESEDNCSIYQILARRTDWETACGYESGQSTTIGDFYQRYADWVAVDPGICQSVFEYGFAPEVPFCCEDVGKSIMVEIMVIDQFCNVDKCWGFVNVEDKLAPIVVEKLPDLSISCNAYAELYQEMFENRDTHLVRQSFGRYSFDLGNPGTFEMQDILCSDLDTRVLMGPFSNGLVSDNCGSTVEERYTLPSGDCEDNYIVREFITQLSGKTGTYEHVFATQKIEIRRCALDLLDIIPPTYDTIVYDCGVSFGIDGKVTIKTAPPQLPDDLPACSQIGIGCFDKVLDIVTGQGCKKVIRTWCVVDWCEVQSVVDWRTIAKDPGSVTFTQYIKIMDTVPPEVVQQSLVADVQTVDCTAQVSSSVSASDGCGSSVDVRWYLKNSEGTVIDFGLGESAAPAAAIQPGQFSWLWVATDDCGNSTELISPFTISSGAKPSVVAYPSLTASLTPVSTGQDGVIDNGIAEIWATEYNSSSSPACGGNPDNLIYILTRGTADETSPVPPNDASALAFDCSDFVTNPTPIPLQFWVKDTVANTADFLNVFLLLYDNNNVCGTPSPQEISSTISGQITTEKHVQIPNVNVQISFDQNELEVVTGNAGIYHVDLPVLSPTMITPRKDSEHANGISTIDLIKVQKHILGLDFITNPFKMIAADVNRDQKINPLDLLQMRQVLLGKIPKFPHSTSWRFVDASYQFRRAHQAMSEDFPEYIEIMSNDRRSSSQDFVGIKVGDLNGDVVSGLGSGRAENSLTLSISEQEFRQGQILKIPVMLDQQRDLEGMQLEWISDATKLLPLGLESGLLSVEKESFFIQEQSRGVMTMSMSLQDVLGVRIPADRPLFYLLAKAQSKGVLSDVLSLGSNLLPEIYSSSDLVPLSVSLRFDRRITKESLPVLTLENRPNPFKTSTELVFNMTEEGDATLSVIDPTGRVLQVIESTFSTGKQVIELDGNNLNPGVMYVRLDTKKGSVTKRIILLE